MEFSWSRKTSSFLLRSFFAIISEFLNYAHLFNVFSFLSIDTFMLIILGLLGIATGCSILLFHPYELLFNWKITFGEGGEIFEKWRKPEVDLYLKVYLFNVTNRDEYLDGRESKLRFQQVGPYVYKWVI